MENLEVGVSECILDKVSVIMLLDHCICHQEPNIPQAEGKPSLDFRDRTTCTTAMLSQCIRMAERAQNLAQDLKARRMLNISSISNNA